MWRQEIKGATFSDSFFISWKSKLFIFKYLNSSYSVLTTVLSTLKILTHFIFKQFHEAFSYFIEEKVKVLVVQSCLTLCDPMDCSPPGSSVLGDSPGKNTGVGCHPLLQGIFLIQRLNLGLLHCRQIYFYHLSHQGNPGWEKQDTRG